MVCAFGATRMPAPTSVGQYPAAAAGNRVEPAVQREEGMDSEERDLRFELLFFMH